MKTTDPTKGVTLGTFLSEDPRIGVVLWCLTCGHRQGFGMAEVINRLDQRGIDGRKVGIRELPRYLRKPCPKCSGVKHEGRPDFNPTFTGPMVKR